MGGRLMGIRGPVCQTAGPIRRAEGSGHDRRLGGHVSEVRNVCRAVFTLGCGSDGVVAACRAAPFSSLEPGPRKATGAVVQEGWWPGLAAGRRRRSVCFAVVMACRLGFRLAQRSAPHLAKVAGQPASRALLAIGAARCPSSTESLPVEGAERADGGGDPARDCHDRRHGVGAGVVPA